MVKKAKIDVRLNCEVTPDLVAQISPDVLIAAVGASPVKLPIRGFEKTLPILDYYENNPERGRAL